jgi:hypothetical protein
MVNVAGSEFGQRGPMAGSAWCGSGAWRAAGSGIRVWHRDVIRPGGRHFSVANKFLWHRGDRWFGAARQGSHELLSDPSLGVAGEVRTSPAKDSRRMCMAWRTYHSVKQALEQVCAGSDLTTQQLHSAHDRAKFTCPLSCICTCCHSKAASNVSALPTNAAARHSARW